MLPVVQIFCLTIMTYFKKLIGIKSAATKQRPARLSRAPVKLSSFIGDKFFPQMNFMISDARVTGFNI